jgi:glycosyltransferase involved in cell wall biosynthesis
MLLAPSLRSEYQLVLAGAKGNAGVFGDAGLDRLPPDARFTGYVDQANLPALYAGATIFAYPSLYEGFGLPPLEAMACGIPVLTSNTSSVPEVVGKAAVSVDPESPDAIAAGLRELMTNQSLRERLATEGLKRAAQLSWDNTARTTWEILAREACLWN